MSCTPYPPDGPGTGPIQIAEKVESIKDPSLYAQSEFENQKSANRSRLAAKMNRNGGSVTEKQVEPAEVTQKEELTPVKPKSKYPTAVNTRDGFVTNPFTGQEVDVRGVPAGSIVYDPDDPNWKTNRFRVP